MLQRRDELVSVSWPHRLVHLVMSRDTEMQSLNE